MAGVKPFAAGVRWKNGAWRYCVPRWVSDAMLCRVCGCKREVPFGRLGHTSTTVTRSIYDRKDEMAD